MSEVELCCAGCGRAFTKAKKEVTRRRKAGCTEFFCGTSCYARARGSRNLGHELGSGRVSNLLASNRQDPDSPFRYFLRKARSRGRGADLDAAFLQALWDDQQGRCSLSGIKMALPRNSLAWESNSHDPWKPSLDRIDPSLPYRKGNVRFVTVLGNLARGRFSDADLVRFCAAVVEKQQGASVRLEGS